MLEPHTKKDIEKRSIEILKGCGAYGVFPTPVDSIVTYSELVVGTGIDVNSIKDNFLSFFSSDILKSGLAKIRGLLDRSEKVIYLDNTQNFGRKNFVKLHEVGHEVLPWQKKSLAYLDDDTTLSEYVNEDFEEEANYFASITLFQHDRFIAEMSKLELGIKAPMALAKQFGASVHATIRRYVEHSKKRCALLILENISLMGQPASCNARDYFQSSKFEKTFGILAWPETMGFRWPFVQHYYFGKKFTQGVVALKTENGEVDFEFHFFNNTYNAFVLLFPKGEKNKTRTKIVLAYT